MVAERNRHIEHLTGPYVIGPSLNEAGAGHHESEAALRWRDVLLRLSDNMIRASHSRPDLAPILRHALDYAIELLLTEGNEDQLFRLEQWLHEAEATLQDAPPLKRGNVNRESLLRIAA